MQSAQQLTASEDQALQQSCARALQASAYLRRVLAAQGLLAAPGAAAAADDGAALASAAGRAWLLQQGSVPWSAARIEAACEQHLRALGPAAPAPRRRRPAAPCDARGATCCAD